MEIVGNKRTQLGKKNKVLRRIRQLPAVVFGGGIESANIAIPSVSFKKALDVAGYTGLIDLVFEDFSEKVLIKEVQVHPVSMEPIHASFFKVNLKEKTTASIPVEFINQEANLLIKSGDAMLLSLIDEVEVEALPTDLPKNFEVDVSKLTDFEQTITVADLNFDSSKIEIINNELEDILAKLDRAQMAEEVVDETIDEAAAIEGLEATAEKKPEEEDAEAAESKE